MRLTRLVGSAVRNLADFDLDVDAPFVVLHGANAQGKTNVLEAVWYLAALKPLRTSRPRELIRWGEGGLQLAGWVTHGGIVRHRRIDLEGGSRTIQLDGKRCGALSEYFEDVRAIAFTPADGEIVTASPDLRRRWVDRASFTARPAHLELVRGYAKVLANKGATLRSDRPDLALLDTLNVQLAMLGARLAQRRAELLAELAPHVGTMMNILAGRQTQIRLSLRTTAQGSTEAERQQTLVDALIRSRPGELRRRRTLVGPQTDDVAIHLDDQPARNFASRGQVRSIVLALKLAELLAARERGVIPLFLLDDLSSELDRSRTGRLVGLLGDLGAQVIATTTDPDHVDVLPGSGARRIRVEDGILHPEVTA